MLLRNDSIISSMGLEPLTLKTECRPSAIRIGQHYVGFGQPVYIVAEIGINHNGSLKTALKLIDIAVDAGCDAVKFQKRFPDQCVPKIQQKVFRDTPWGRMTYLQYRHRMEFDAGAYDIIHRHCRKRGIEWFASCWDTASVDFMQQFQPPCYKIASACLTDEKLLRYLKKQAKPIILSTGMSTMQEIRQAVSVLTRENLLIAHTTSNYSGTPEELNLSMITTLKNEFKCPTGYSGHEKGTVTTIATVAMGACYVERHITLSHSMWGSDHAVSLEPEELTKMIRDIRLLEKALGDGVKRVYDSEKTTLAKLRNCL